MKRALHTCFAMAFVVTLGLSTVGCETSGSGSERTTEEKTKPMMPEQRQGTITELSNPM
ncbi:MAG TPA: hypothetical protein VGN72_06135 [Tepidisphaeraceae bacterium]|nr:hypothetical protein [Tepidisphaeraceae bacterium]